MLSEGPEEESSRCAHENNPALWEHQSKWVGGRRDDLPVVDLVLEAIP